MVSVLDFVFDEDKKIPEGTVVYFVELKDQFNRLFYDKLLYIYLAMPRFHKTILELLTPQDNWLYILKNLPDLTEVPATFQHGILAKIFKVADMANLTREERRDYEESVKQYRDLKNVTDTAFYDGRMKEKEALILKGHRKGLSVDLLAELTELSEKQVLAVIQRGKNPNQV